MNLKNTFYIVQELIPLTTMSPLQPLNKSRNGILKQNKNKKSIEHEKYLGREHKIIAYSLMD